MRFLAILLCTLTLGLTSIAAAQLAAPNASGVAMGHLHYWVRDVEANKDFWVRLGGTSGMFGTTQTVTFPGVIVFLREAESSGNTDGSVLNHVAFRVRSVAEIESRGFDVTYNDQFPGVVYIYTPGGERIELFDDGLATNLGFTTDNDTIDPVADRHNRPLDDDIVSHHIHFYVPEDQVLTARDWYAAHFGGVAGKRWRYDAVDLPGINFNFSSSDETLAPTAGRMLDHIGLEVVGLEAFCARLAAAGVAFDTPYRTLPSGLGLAFLTDPWGTRIELTEGLRDL